MVSPSSSIEREKKVASEKQGRGLKGKGGNEKDVFHRNILHSWRFRREVSPGGKKKKNCWRAAFPKGGEGDPFKHLFGKRKKKKGL